jgi:hypothetical protein
MLAVVVSLFSSLLHDETTTEVATSNSNVLKIVLFFNIGFGFSDCLVSKVDAKQRTCS